MKVEEIIIGYGNVEDVEVIGDIDKGYFIGKRYVCKNGMI